MADKHCSLALLKASATTLLLTPLMLESQIHTFAASSEVCSNHMTQFAVGSHEAKYICCRCFGKTFCFPDKLWRCGYFFHIFSPSLFFLPWTWMWWLKVQQLFCYHETKYNKEWMNLKIEGLGFFAFSEAIVELWAIYLFTLCYVRKIKVYSFV